MTPTSHTLVLGGDAWTLVEVRSPAEVGDAVTQYGRERVGVIVVAGEGVGEPDASGQGMGRQDTVTQAVRARVMLVLDRLPTGEYERSVIDVAVREGRVHASSGLASALLVAGHRLACEAAPQLDLTPREREILELVSRGQSNRSVASSLYLSEFTVRNHLGRVFRKLGVTTRAEAAQALLDERAASGAGQDGSPPAPNH